MEFRRVLFRSELETACKAGFADVILAYAAHGPHVESVLQIAGDHPGVTISTLVEDAAMVVPWRGSNVSLFIDLNSGMDRTGMPLDRHDDVLALARAIREAGLRIAGDHPGAARSPAVDAAGSVGARRGARRSLSSSS